MSTVAQPAESPRNAHIARLGIAFGLICTAELLAAGPSVTWALVLHATLLAGLLALTVVSVPRDARLYLSLALIPLVRIIAFTMPVWFTDRLGFLALVNVPLIVGIAACAYVVGYSASDLNLSLGNPFTQLTIGASGILIGFAESYIIQPAPLAASLAPEALVWPFIALLLFTGLSEELLFRGLLQHSAVLSLGAWPGMVFVSLLFGVMHIGWNSALDVAFVAGIGLCFAWLVHRTGSILGVTLAHGIANIMLFVVIPLLGT